MLWKHGDERSHRALGLFKSGFYMKSLSIGAPFGLKEGPLGLPRGLLCLKGVSLSLPGRGAPLGLKEGPLGQIGGPLT